MHSQPTSANAPFCFRWFERCSLFVLCLCSLFFAIILCSDEHFISHDGCVKECKEEAWRYHTRAKKNITLDTKFKFCNGSKPLLVTKIKIDKLDYIKI